MLIILSGCCAINGNEPFELFGEFLVAARGWLIVSFSGVTVGTFRVSKVSYGPINRRWSI